MLILNTYDKWFTTKQQDCYAVQVLTLQSKTRILLQNTITLLHRRLSLFYDSVLSGTKTSISKNKNFYQS